MSKQTITKREWRTAPKAPHRQDEPTQLEPPPPPDMTPRLWRRVAKAYGMTPEEYATLRAAGVRVSEYRQAR